MLMVVIINYHMLIEEEHYTLLVTMSKIILYSALTYNVI